MKTAESPRARDRDATESGIVDAAKTLIARKGYAALGVNAVAREAGCDKQLIYRYFGGLDGLIEAIGEEAANWVEAALAHCQPAPGTDYGEAVQQFLVALLDALKEDDLMMQLIGWELTDRSPAVQRMAEVRSKAILERVVPMLRAARPPREGIDAPAANALLIGAVQHVAMAAAVQGGFAGMALSSEADWKRLKEALKSVVSSVY